MASLDRGVPGFMKTQQAEKEVKLMGFVWEAKAADGRGLFQAVVETGTIGTMSGNDEVTVGRLSTFVDLMLLFCSAQPNRPSRTHLSRHQAGRLHSAGMEPMGDSLGLIALTRGESGLWAATAAALSTPRMNAGVSRATG